MQEGLEGKDFAGERSLMENEMADESDNGVEYRLIYMNKHVGNI